MKRALLTLIVLAGGAQAAFAQPETRTPAPTLELRMGFGASNYVHGDIEYVAPTVLLSVRAGIRRFAIEPEIAFASRAVTETFPGATVTSPVVVEQSHQFRSVGVNALARGRGRIAPFFGGGVGVYSERRRSSTDGAGYTLSFGPRLGTQIIGGLDARVLPRIRMFGQFRFEVRSFGDPGGGAVAQGLAGVAIALR